MKLRPIIIVENYWIISYKAISAISARTALVNMQLRCRKKASTIHYACRGLYRKYSWTSVFPNTRASEQQQRNKIKKKKKNVRREPWVWKQVQWARKKGVPTVYNYLIKIQIHKNNMALCYKIWKKYNSIQLTKKFTRIIKKWTIIQTSSSGLPSPRSLIRKAMDELSS